MPPMNPEIQLRSALATTMFGNSELDTVRLLKLRVRSLLYELNGELRSRCLAKLVEFRASRTPEEKAAIVDEIARDYPQSRLQVAQVLELLADLGRFLLESNLPKEDYRFWASDFVVLEWIGDEVALIFTELINKLVDECLPELEILTRKRQSEVGVLPSFQSLGITVEARAVNRSPYKWGTPIFGSEAYVPEIVGTVIVASVHLGVNHGSPTDFYFQSDENGIDNLVSSLMAAKSEMAALRKYLKLDPENDEGAI